MKIRGLSELVNDELEKFILNDKTVVIDGQNFFHNLFDKSWMPFIFGTESDRYAKYLRKYLMKYKKANVKCYFVLSGHVNIQKPFKNNTKNDFINSIFQADIFVQVLESMKFEYVLCHTNAKNECIALARKLSCPIISFDIDFVFSDIDYIPYTQDKSNDLIIYDEATGNLQCGLFKLNNFLEKYNVTKKNLAIFIVLTDQNIYPEHLFNNYFKTLNIPVGNKERITHLLTYLSQKKISEFKLREAVNQANLKKLTSFNKNVENAYKYLLTQRGGEISNLFLTLGSENQIKERDELWFQKGILLKYISIPYINLFLHNTLITSSFVEDNGHESAIKFSLDIIKYAHDLLKNFDGHGIIVRQKSDESKTSYADPLIYSHSIAKPTYEAEICIFENGWLNIRRLNLFQHFITQTIPPFDFIELEVAPEDARLLIIALVYFARKKKTIHKNVSFSILLSYVMLGVVMEAALDSSIKKEVTNKPVLESITDVTLVTKEDCVTAKYLMNDYFTYTHATAKRLFDGKVLQTLAEFQYCLQHFYLNKLCGYPFKPTIYEKTYNGTFVYKTLSSVKQKCFQSICDVLNPAATVLAFFIGLIEIYQAILYDTDASYK